MSDIYADLVEIKRDDVCGEKDWYWIKGDMNAWDGPWKNWAQSHSKKYFEDVKKFNVCVTAGANHGLHCRFYAKKFTTTYAFEPNPLAFYCMVLNNPYDNVVKMNCALGATVELVSMVGNWKTTSGVSKVTPGGTIPCLTIDTLNLQACDLIQLDVEGYEEKIIRGAKRTIEKFRPVVIAENGKRDPIMKLMKEWNYRYTGNSVSDSIWVPLKL